LGIASFDAPHLLILDEPTNHLDIDSRAALLEAINDYEGAVVLVSHDRRLLEACADRLWVVEKGGVRVFEGDLDEYARQALARTGAQAREPPSPEPPRPGPQEPRPADAGALRRRLAAAEEKVEKLSSLLARVDAKLTHPETFAKNPREAAQLAAQRAELAEALAAAEEQWLEAAVRQKAQT